MRLTVNLIARPKAADTHEPCKRQCMHACIGSRHARALLCQRREDHAGFLPARKLGHPDQVPRAVESELPEALAGLVVREVELGTEVRHRSLVEWQQLFKVLVKAANLELTAAAAGREAGE